MRCASYDGTAGCHLYRGNAATVQHDKTVTVSGTKGTDVSGKGDDGVLGEGICVGGGVFVGDVKVVAADESDA
jgi:hypothetical protein